jgi:hypothetical protein
MGFLGKLASFGSKFLGHANKAASFIGRNLHHVSSGLKSVSDFVKNPDVRRIGQDVGIAPSIFNTTGRVADTLQNSVNLLPTIAGDVSRGATAAMGQIQPSTRASLADLYQQANNIV